MEIATMWKAVVSGAAAGAVAPATASALGVTWAVPNRKVAGARE